MINNIIKKLSTLLHKQPTTANTTNVTNELMTLGSNATDTIRKISKGNAELKLIPLHRETQKDLDTYNLELKSEPAKIGPMSVGIYQISKGNYPIKHWHSISSWRTKPEDQLILNHHELKGHFEWIVENQQSPLVVHVLFILQVLKDKTLKEVTANAIKDGIYKLENTDKCVQVQGNGQGDGFGEGDYKGNGQGCGHSSGYGCGNGNGEGLTDKYGFSIGYGYGQGQGNGQGNGQGQGNGHGHGLGNGKGDGYRYLQNK